MLFRSIHPADAVHSTAMNWVVMNVGTVCTADGPCLIPVWPGIMAPSGVLMAGVALVLRDGLQAKLGVRWSLYAIIIGAALSALFWNASECGTGYHDSTERAATSFIIGYD